MKIAIYSRKSKLAESGDSIKNQIQICIDYINAYYPESAEPLIYEDEGYSGGSMERPMFRRLLKDIENRKINVLICYRLDRISRNVADFSETLKMLDDNGVGFISVKERFDTTTPIGRAMMYIASVFAQLERDTIAERISDNLVQLAIRGNNRYLGAAAPFGYQKVRKVNENGKKFNVLEQMPEEADTVNLIYDKYIELQSLNKLKDFLFQNGFKTKKGCQFDSSGLNRLLRHPLYAAADGDMYNYFKNLGVQFSSERGDFDGNYGITVFGRAGSGGGKINRLNGPDKWIIGVGAHMGIIDSKRWLLAQKLLSANGGGARRTYGLNGLLNGILHCGVCGGYMRPYCIRKNGFYYVCATKERLGRQKCDNSNIRGDVLDADVFNFLYKSLAVRDDIVNGIILQQEETLKKESGNSKRLLREIAANEKAIKNLLKKLAENDSALIDAYIKEEIKSLDTENNRLKSELTEADINVQAAEEAACAISSLLEFDYIDAISVRNMLKIIVKAIYWDGRCIKVTFCDN